MEWATIIWNFDPELISSPISIRYYGLCWAFGFLIGYPILRNILQRERPEDYQKLMDKILMYCMVGGVVGARLGHVFFYGPYFSTETEIGYFDHPLTIITGIREGGLASHGGTIGVIIAAYLFNRKHYKTGLIHLLDRLTMPAALVAAFIRLGNLLNSEILGTETSLPWGFKFIRLYGEAGEIMRHPTQIYECLSLLLTFFVLHRILKKTESKFKNGYLLGIFLILCFSFRFLIEFVKEHQTLADSSALSMGQILSIPLVAIGMYLISRKTPNSDLN